MSSSTDLPIFCNIPSVIQVQSSSGLSFHLIKYWKYSCPLVLLNTLLSNIFSGCNVCAGGSCSFHSICSFSADLSSAPSSSYLYKSATLKMGDIPTSGGNSISYALVEKFLSILHGPIFLNFSLLYYFFGNLSFLKCAKTRSPTSKWTSFLLKYALLLYLMLLPCSCCFTCSCMAWIFEENSSPSALLSSALPCCVTSSKNRRKERSTP